MSNYFKSCSFPSGYTARNMHDFKKAVGKKNAKVGNVGITKSKKMRHKLTLLTCFK